jgi:pSer/pThr/pTyr-binding forkhead associated (FHA) protein
MIDDKTVSVEHASIVLFDGKIRLKDLNSLNGTLVLIKKDLELYISPIYLNVGKYILKIFTEPKDILIEGNDFTENIEG